MGRRVENPMVRKSRVFPRSRPSARVVPDTPTHSDRPPPGVSAELRSARVENPVLLDYAGSGAGRAVRCGGHRAGPGTPAYCSPPTGRLTVASRGIRENADPANAQAHSGS